MLLLVFCICLSQPDFLKAFFILCANTHLPKINGTYIFSKFKFQKYIQLQHKDKGYQSRPDLTVKKGRCDKNTSNDGAVAS